MKTTIKKELAAHVLDRINDGIIDNGNREEWHFYAFNEDYYIIGYYQASEWLKRHDMDAFEAIETVQEYEKDNFGETSTKINSEAIVNMLAYIYGEELLNGVDVETVDELKEEMESIIED
jgi:hypothetical protein